MLAGDRTASRVAAHRHTLLVRTLKAALPLMAVATVSMFGATILKATGWGTGIPQLEMPKILPENLAMQNPHYEGFNKDGGRYWVRADSAQQDLKTLSLIKLNGINGELLDAKKQKTTLVATRGTFDNKANILELYDSITVDGDAGMKAKLTRATVDTKENVITSREPVTVTMEAGTISANQMTARQKVKEYTFVDNVRTHLNARPAKPETTSKLTAAKTDVLAGASNAPVDIASNRLDVNDATKTALFTGMVRAVQDGASMTTPELEVTYTGSAAPQAGQSAQVAQSGNADGGSKIKRLLAKNPVSLTQANGDNVSAQSADVDPIAQRAVLDGEVIMTQAPDKRATADRAEIDQATNSVLLTGDVVVTQGQNILKGRRLTFNRGTSKMQLTSNAPAGRISARFQQAGANPAAAKPKAEQKSEGIAFGASFKTDPNAPVLIDAARLDVDDASKQAVFTGDVHAVQGEFNIRAAEITASYTGSAALAGGTADTAKQSAAQLTRIRAKTKVAITSKDDQSATGDWADFDPKANTAVLGGDVVLKQGKNVVRGTKLVIDMTTGESVIKSEATARDDSPAVSGNGTATAASPQTGRPSAVFYPGDMTRMKPQQKPAPASGPQGSAWQPQTAPSPKP